MQIQSLNSTSAVTPQSRLNENHEPLVANANANAKASVSSSAAPVSTMSPVAVQAVDSNEQAKQVEDAVKKINDTVKSLNQSVGLEFSTDEDTKIRVVKLVDTNSKEVLRQIPTEEVVTIAKALDKLQGLLVRDKA